MLSAPIIPSDEGSDATRAAGDLSRAGYRRIANTSVVCITTRVRLRHWWLLPVAYVRFRRLARLQTRGLLRSAFSVESPTTFHTLSVFRDASSLVTFGNKHEHVFVVRWTFRHAREIWSSEWVLAGASVRMRWDGTSVGPAGAATPVSR